MMTTVTVTVVDGFALDSGQWLTAGVSVALPEAEAKELASIGLVSLPKSAAPEPEAPKPVLKPAVKKAA